MRPLSVSISPVRLNLDGVFICNLNEKYCLLFKRINRDLF